MNPNARVLISQVRVAQTTSCGVPMMVDTEALTSVSWGSRFNMWGESKTQSASTEKSWRRRSLEASAHAPRQTMNAMWAMKRQKALILAQRLLITILNLELLSKKIRRLNAKLSDSTLWPKDIARFQETDASEELISTQLPILVQVLEDGSQSRASWLIWL